MNPEHLGREDAVGSGAERRSGGLATFDVRRDPGLKATYLPQPRWWPVFHRGLSPSLAPVKSAVECGRYSAASPEPPVYAAGTAESSGDRHWVMHESLNAECVRALLDEHRSLQGAESALIAVMNGFVTGSELSVRTDDLRLTVTLGPPNHSRSSLGVNVSNIRWYRITSSAVSCGM